MSLEYQALARKYRPLNFKELVGQEYTKQILINALDSGNLHHGFLFTGTRGVGKTTIARILAKSFNCEIKISSQPCGKCNTCIEIDKGQSIDVIEMDAASRTGVDDMRTLLENTQYAPNKNRFKVYIIDEVHMLSISSFNALLKTLEEPPAHIKFIFATTNPNKLPITILSRCLQFNLQNLSEQEISLQMEKILNNENISFEQEALMQIAEFGNGSMRDSLSILDQAISFGNGSVNEVNIRKMLGIASKDDIFSIVESLFDNDTAKLNKLIEKNEKNGVNLSKLLSNISEIFYQIANFKILANSNKNILQLSKKIDNKTLQIFYQIAINSLKDMEFSPSYKIGLQMSLFRMITFNSENNSLDDNSSKKKA